MNVIANSDSVSGEDCGYFNGEAAAERQPWWFESTTAVAGSLSKKIQSVAEDGRYFLHLMCSAEWELCGALRPCCGGGVASKHKAAAVGHPHARSC